jgi:hypothetical protein
MFDGNNNLHDILHCLQQIGFSMEELPGCVTVLTVLILKLRDELSDKVTDQIKQVAKKFIQDKVVNINSSVLNFKSLFPKYSALKSKWLVPDAVLVALNLDQYDLVDLLLPYWWGPPLTLWYLKTKGIFGSFLCRCISKPVCYGAIPHGTDMFREVDNKLKALAVYCKQVQPNVNFQQRFFQLGCYYIQLVGKYCNCRFTTASQFLHTFHCP